LPLPFTLLRLTGVKELMGASMIYPIHGSLLGRQTYRTEAARSPHGNYALMTMLEAQSEC